MNVPRETSYIFYNRLLYPLSLYVPGPAPPHRNYLHGRLSYSIAPVLLLLYSSCFSFLVFPTFPFLFFLSRLTLPVFLFCFSFSGISASNSVPEASIMYFSHHDIKNMCGFSWILYRFRMFHVKHSSSFYILIFISYALHSLFFILHFAFYVSRETFS